MADLSVPGVLRRAADLIDERGLTGHAWRAADGRVCPLGAIAVACDLSPGVWNLTAAMRSTAGGLALSAGRVLADHVEAQYGNPPWPHHPLNVIAPWAQRADAVTVAASMRAAAEEAEAA